MKTLLTLFVLLFSSSVFADDISDFEIEGISVGDSLLDYMSEEEIKKEIKLNLNRYKHLEKNKFVDVWKYEGLKTYDEMIFFVKLDDKKFIIYDINGSIDFTNDINGCKKKQQEITEIFYKILTNAKKDEGTYIHQVDPSNKSIIMYVRFKFVSGGTILIQCYDHEDSYRIKNDILDVLEVSISSPEIIKWFRP